ncbi:MAG: rhomboid family intramembrane serine protease [Candidatus Korarchaeota archaeon]|nr:rhomboid family intramembrane serine protease [Candidatus Korarchaeota archaeon]
MFPFKDENPSPITPWVTYGLILFNALVFLWEIAGGPVRFELLIYEYGFIPRFFLEDPSSNAYRLFTSMFMHGGWLHLLGNMLYLYIFGDNVEAAFGHFKYIIFYLISGVAASFLHMAVFPLSEIPSVGASGAISGVLGAYLVFFPQARIMTAILVWYFITVEPIPAKYYITFWFIWQLIPGLLAGEATGVAYWAHVGGFIAGVLMAYPYRHRVRYLRRLWMMERYHHGPYW